MSESLLQQFLSEVSRPAILLQILLVLILAVAGIALARPLRRWLRGTALHSAGDAWLRPLTEGAALLAPYLAVLLLTVSTLALLRARAAPVQLLAIGLQLLVSFILVRLAMYALRLVLGAQSWIKHWETRLALAIWLGIAFELVGWFDAIENTLDRIDLLPGKAEFSLWSLIKGLVVITGFVVVTSVISRAIERRVMALTSVALSTRIGVTKFTYFFLVGLGILLGINAAGVDLTALTVLTGAIGLGLGFGLQTIAGNFVSGFVLLMDKSIKPGDVISFTGHTGTSTENFGWVEELRGRYVVVRDRDGVETLVPNQNLITNPVINWSYSDRRVRLKLPVRISYRDDPEVALVELVRATAGNPRVLQDPEPVARLMQFADHGMDLELRFWIADPQNGVNNVRSDVNRAIWRLFKEAGITIPSAQREVWLHNEDRELR
ncbi:MAG: mechanosensitive ion channel [Steroidobacteraceae bacterium]